MSITVKGKVTISKDDDHQRTSVKNFKKEYDDTVISIICLTRGRPQMCIDACASLVDRASSPLNVELLLAFDNDDLASKDIVDCHFKDNALYKSFSYPRYGYARSNEYANQLIEYATGRWIFLWNDDCIMSTQNWDLEVFKNNSNFVLLIPSVKCRGRLMPPHTCQFPIIPMLWYEILGFYSGDVAMDSSILFTMKNLSRPGKTCIVHEESILILHDQGKVKDRTWNERKPPGKRAFMKGASRRASDAIKIKNYLDDFEK